MPILIDTGILLRGFAHTDPNYEEIRRALRQLRREREEFFASFQNIAEFVNVSTRPSTARGGYGLPLDMVDKRVAFIERTCRVITESPACYLRWRDVIARHGVSGVAVHDARLVAAMLENGIDRLLTLNDRDFRRYEAEGIVVITPKVVLS